MGNYRGRSGLSLGSVLLIVFVVLKLTGLISWSWLWVLSPLWISLILVVGVLVGVFGMLAILGLTDAKRSKWRGR